MLTGCTKTENYGVKLPVAVTKFYYGFKNAHFKTMWIYTIKMTVFIAIIIMELFCSSL